MNGSTKILTVSYGTFSCTLEGFDDPLGSMREIAEYFRDLAADDRYFGAEPPTPDVEMLQNIAEKEVQRRVEARVSDAGVALVASDKPAEPVAEPTKAAPVQDAPTDGSDVSDSGPLTFDDDFLMSDEPEDVLAVDPGVTAKAEGPAESVAEKLRRIRAVVSRSIEEAEEENPIAPDAAVDGPPKRERALTRTIEAITADLSDDEDASDVIEDAVEVDTSDEREDHHEDDVIATEAETAALADDADDDDDADLDIVDAEDEVVEDNDDDDEDDDAIAQSVSDVIGAVTTRLGTDDTDADEEPDVAASPSAQRVVSRTLSPEPEANIGRLMDETDNKLNEDETVRRRRVISQMRAAVAATKADRMVTRLVTTEDEEEAEKDLYRGDLSEVVQDVPSEGTRKANVSAPPLMLVSSQRVDESEANASAEVEPASEPVQLPESFAAFVESVGAKELHELLEAAAAYTVFAEGQSSFTRPEIMKRVAHADPTLQLTREDSLRSFGQLLRQGKIRKLERGQFTIDEETRYHPTQRFAGE